MARGSVLVVEDDSAIRRGLVDALSFAGYSVTESRDGSDAVQLALEMPIDLVLLDVMLPGVDGFAILKQLRRRRSRARSQRRRGRLRREAVQR